MNVVVIGLSHHLSPVELRERYAFAEIKIPEALKSLQQSGVAGEAVVLSTCNRVEIYAATDLEPTAAFAELKKFLVAFHSFTKADELRIGIQALAALPPPQSPTGKSTESRISNSNSLNATLPPPKPAEEFQLADDQLYTLAEPQSLHHLFKVACGLDSMMLGETEILGQLKQAYALAHRHGCTGARLNKAFQRAFHVAKHIRTHTNIQRGSVSVASAAVELAEKIFSSLNDRDVLIIGAGEMSEKTARALLSRGARNVVVANRSLERARILAKELGGRAVPFDAWAAEFENIDIVISSTSAPRPILDRAQLEPLMQARKQRPVLLVDIAVPRDVDPEVNFLENIYLYNIDDLQAIADDYLKQRKDEIVRCEAIISEKVKPLLELKNSQARLGTGGHGYKAQAYPA